MKTGLFDNITHDEYHSIEAVSNSYLSRLKKCPAAAKIKQEETASMTFGSAFHALLLEGLEVFNERFVVAPEINRRTNAGKAEYAEFLTENADKTIISKDDYNTSCEMVNAVIAHPFAIRLLYEGKSEMTCLWKDKETGLYCKCRPDRVPNGDYGVIVDIKTTRSANKDSFTRSIIQYGYHRQAAYYLDGFKAVANSNVDTFIFIAVEKEPPYMVGCFALSDADLDYGRMRYRELMEKELEYREQGLYPHYEDEGLQQISLPQWA